MCSIATFRIGFMVCLATMLLVPRAHAINIIMEYTDAGSTPPHPENPTWDPDGSILIAHFQAAEAIWESLLPGGGSYTFDFHWDNDIGVLGQYTTGGDDYIEINPDYDWFADPDPFDDVEFNAGVQKLYSGLSASDQSTFFPGTAPPGSLEVSYRGAGMLNGTFVGGAPVDTLSASEQVLPGTATPVDSSNGFDLLSVILHEIGHALGIEGTEPGEYNIDPQHLGGLTNVLVLEHPDSGHLGGNAITPGFLMNPGTPRGQRVFATATDVLAIAEDQGITVVQLARVGRISSGNWSDTTAWIGGDMPDGTQDVYITHGGVVTVDVGAQANDVLVASGNGLAVQAGQSIGVNGTLTFTGGALTVGAGGWIAANTLVGNPGSIYSAAGSLVRFNQFTEIAATSASLAGSLAIGFDTDPSGLISPLTTDFNPSLATWNIAENLIVGDENFAHVVVDNGTWTVNGNVALGKVLTATGGGWGGSVTLQNSAIMSVGGNVTVEGPSAAVIVEGTATLDIAGNITIGKVGQFIYRGNRTASNRTYSIAGGQTVVVSGPVGPPDLLRGSGGAVTFEDTANAADATMTLEGGAGDGATGAQVFFKGSSVAGDVPAITVPPTFPTAAKAEFRTKGGRRGPTLSGFEIDGLGGQVVFQNTSTANDAVFINEGISDWYGGTGGRTIFTNNSSADRATINNHGATTAVAFLGPVMAGATHFYDFSTAGTANITNHTDGAFSGASWMSAQTVFFDSSDAGNATIENEGATNQTANPGRTEFRGFSSAALSNIHNRAHLTPGGAAGRTIFYDSATAADATIHTYDGYSDHGRIEFYNQSTAARARIIIENDPLNTASAGGYLNFFDNATAAQSQIFLRAGTQGTVQFYNNATAANAQIITETGVGNPGNILFNDSSTAANANISLGESSFMAFYGQSTAANATIAMANRAKIDFQGTSAGQAQIVAAGGSTNTGGVQAFINFLGASATAANSTITVNGASATLASPALVQITGGASPGNATLIANGGTNGGAGGAIVFNGAANGSTARIIANADSLVDFFSQAIYNDISFGSIEGAGNFALRGAHVTTGSRNTSTTVSGPIVDNPPGFSTGGRLTKVGAGTLTLAGVNTYSGVTTVNAGAVSVTGSIAGGAIVNNGGTLNGTGTIAGGVTINSGGVFAPGLSPGTLTVGGLSMLSGGTLNFELGDPLRDHIFLTGNGHVSLAGTLNLSLLGGFTPTLGQSFPLFEGSIGSISGAFNSIVAPIFNGLTFNVVQNANSVLLQVGESTIQAGDFNGDGTVDGADLTNWRIGFGASGAATHMQGDADGDFDADGADFLVWQRQLGSTAVAAAADGVPEPASIWLLCIGVAPALISRRRR